ncbi:unnamed protein product [Soboliphyme baturini]|uniref:WW domain-containing protein n=1 Tax=Soboliphyme baturini TaxID=241478 RepID=A0A183J507_9BILA|nr:unnamed protein product [Soboliphyme baturini]
MTLFHANDFSHILKTTTWEDPRQSFPKESALNLPPLPCGWEETTTSQGEKYFINHNNKTTTWFDPRLPEEVQRPAILQRHSSINDYNSAVMMPNRYEDGILRIPQPPAAVNAQLSTQMGMKQQAAMFSPSSQQRVEELIQERQQYRSRQQEIIRQVYVVSFLVTNEL